MDVTHRIIDRYLGKVRKENYINKSYCAGIIIESRDLPNPKGYSIIIFLE